MATKAFLGLVGAVALAGATTAPGSQAAKPTQPPNFIFIITDDQDLRLGSLDHQPKVRKHLVEQGTTFSKHYCTVALCCPSRVSLLTGRAAHNTNVTDVKEPYGGYPKFLREGWNENYLPVWLQDAGYNTFYTGKLMNGHSTSTWNAPYAKGWTGNDFFLDPNTYMYHNVTLGHNKGEAKTWTGQYSTDLAANSSLGFLDQAIAAQQGGDVGSQKPFFLGVAPIGPHSETIRGTFNPPVAAERHKDLFPDLKIPRTPNFNPDTPSGGGWIKREPQANQTVVDYWDEFYRLRIRALQAVDELVEALVARLEAHPAVLANTYVIYTSDNGYHVGQHRLPPGKTCALEEDINVPFVIRGPGVAPGADVAAPTSHTDVVPTLFRLAGLALQDGFDGVPMPVTEALRSAAGRRSEHVNVEFWGANLPEGAYTGIGIDPENTYKSLRILGEDYDISYTVWCTNEHELYDMKNDPWQMNNIYGTAAPTFGWDTAKLTARVDALLLALKSCRGRGCREPWAALHPQGDVHSLRDAMAARFDHFYLLEQPKVAFSACMPGYLPAFEGPLEAVKYGGGGIELRAVP